MVVYYIMQKYLILSDISESQTPRVFIKKNDTGKIVMVLSGWENKDGWTPAETKELIFTLETSLEKSKQINSVWNTNLLFN